MDEELIPFSENEDPCDNCPFDCDMWDAHFCCQRCRFYGQDDCENCDRDDI